MKQTYSKLGKIKALLLILGPIFMTQITMYLMSFFDVMMTGRFSPEHLAGLAVGTSLWIPIFTALNGLFSAITPIVSQLVGAGKKEEVRDYIYQGLFLSIKLFAIILLIGYLFLDVLLMRMGLEEEVARVATYYLVTLSFGMFAAFFYHVLRSFMDALGKTNYSMAVMLLSLPINITLNYILIFGKLGFPAMGGVGAGIATAITYWLIMLISLWFVVKHDPFTSFRIFQRLPIFHYQKWKEIIVIGVPIALSIFLEMSIFSAVTLLMSEFGTIVIAGHQAALNFVYLLYMVPLSMSMALTILVGFEVGAGRFKDARTYSYLGVTVGIALVVIISAIVFVFKEAIGTIYSTDPAVIALTAQFLLFALLFQLSDAFQAPIQGVLRGYKDVNAAMFISLASYWLIGLPVGIVLARMMDFGPFGYWIGLIIGLTMGAIMLTLRLSYVQKTVHKQTRHLT